MEQNKYEQFKSQARLPKFAVPKRYDIKLKPDLVACKFSGTVEITVDVVSDTQFMVLNAAQLSVDYNSVRFRSISKVLGAKEVELIEKDEIMVVDFAESLPVGVGILCIAFKGTLTDKMIGFYKSTYEHNGEKKNMAMTQFAPAHARKCFPCWDEPASKATFKITLEVPSELVALSNMPVVEEKVDGNLKTVYYQESPIMSSYLVAVVVGLFDYVEDHTSDGTKVRVYCPVGNSNQGKFALDVAVKTLGLFKEYFSLPYSLPKLDMIAVPTFGAMENYGLVTYQERLLLYDDKQSAAANKQMIANVVAHELAHQWFGNLVTMEWWTDLWLNEGFATWIAYLANDSLFPEWQVWTQFLNESTEGLRLDGLAESHPIEVEINHACETVEIFDSITYSKGASVIRMLQSYLGPETFQRALASYIKKYASSNAKTEDLWAVLEEESGEPVNKLMDSWTKQQGHPVISAKVKGQALEFEQSQFLLSGSHAGRQWIVPITLCCGSYDARRNLLLKTKSESLDMKELLNCSISQGSLLQTGSGGGNYNKDSVCAWIKLNVDQSGFYRVNYDNDLLARLQYAIEMKRLSATDRYGILDDSFALCMGGKQSLTSLLTLMNAFREELDYTVLLKLIRTSYKVADIVADGAPELVTDVKLFLMNLFQHSAERLGWDPKQGESHLDAMLRGELLTALAMYGHDATLKEASKRFQEFLDDRDTPLLPPDIRGAAYSAVIQNVSTSNRSDYESLLRIYKETNLSQERMRILVSLRSCGDPDIILENLNLLLSSEIHRQDILNGIGVRRVGREIAWNWMKDNWDHISQNYGSEFGVTTRFVYAYVSQFSSLEKAKEVEEFFATRTKREIARTLKQSLEQVHVNANWVESVRNEKHLAEAVKDLAYRKY